MFLLFFFVWIVFNGRITVEIVMFGVAIAALLFAFVCKFMDYSLQKEKRLYKNILFGMKYVYVLLKEIVKANIAVGHLVLTQREEVEPVIVTFHSSLRSETSRVVLANSITLTPGTITVSLEENKFTVHCLDKSLADGIEDSVFVKMLQELECGGDKE